MKTVLVNVTQEDINEGACSDCRFCPEARAIQRATGNRFINVYRGFAGYKEEEIEISLEIDNHIAVFDSVRKMEPHSWQIELPDHWVKM